MKQLLLIYLLTINASGFLLMHIDKRRAQKKRWRIRESTLLAVAAFGGSLGSLLGMYTFRHKIRHRKFTVCIPLFLLLHIALLVWFLSEGC